MDRFPSYGIPFRTSYITGPAIQVTGAGLEGVNALYTKRGLLNTRPFYNTIGVSSDSVVNSIYWTGSAWRIADSATRFTSADDVATPDLVTTWTAVSEEHAPVPVVDEIETRIPAPAGTLFRADGLGQVEPLTSPNGTMWRITIDNAGVFSLVSID